MLIKLFGFAVLFSSITINCFGAKCPCNSKCGTDYKYDYALYQEAADEWDAQNATDYYIWNNLYNITSADWDYGFTLEVQGLPTPDERQGQVLLWYEKKLKEKGVCQRDLKNYVAQLPKEARCPFAPNVTCDRNAKYSRLDGFCNNPLDATLGATQTAMNRFVPPNYSDGIHAFKKTRDGCEYPNPRVLGDAIGSVDKDSCYYKKPKLINNVAALFLSQATTHDITYTKLTQMQGLISNAIQGCDPSYLGPLPPSLRHPQGCPMSFPNNDWYYANKSIYCMTFIRMQPTVHHRCKGTAAIQKNIATAVLDNDGIYSHTMERLNVLRSFSGGKFNLSAGYVLPEYPPGQYVIGYDVAPQNIGFGLAQSWSYRLHNKIAECLQQRHPSWSDEQTFWEARRWYIAIWQNFHYNELLPSFLGKEICYDYKLTCGNGKGKCDEYSPHIDMRQFVEHGGAAFRLFHVNTNDYLHFLNETGGVTKIMPLGDTFNQVNIRDLETMYEDLTRGFLYKEWRWGKFGFGEQMRTMVLPTIYKNFSYVGSDLLFWDLTRGRDLGIENFAAVARKYLNEKIECWADLKPFFSKRAYKLARKMYKDFEDLELFPGLLLEKKYNWVVGRLSAAMMAEQFYRIRYGDRYFYKNPKSPHPFTKEQIKFIESIRLANIICSITNLTEVPKQALYATCGNNPLVSCADLKIDCANF